MTVRKVQRQTSTVGNLVVCALLCLAQLLSTSAHALDPRERLNDPALEQRARALSAELRCLVCQNQSIDDSDAPLAKDLRLLVRRRLTSGDSDREVLDYIVARYGEFVLLRPPFNSRTLLLWLAPLLLLLGVIGFVWMKLRQRPLILSDAASVPLNAAEQRALDELIGSDQAHAERDADR